MLNNYPNRMIEPEQLTNRAISKVRTSSEAKSQALESTSQRSGIAIQDLVANETYGDRTIYVSVQHPATRQNFHYEYELIDS